MNTIAVWYEEKNLVSQKKQNKVGLDIHVNFWKLKVAKKFPKIKNPKSEYLMDFGFMIYDITDVEKLNIHFPFSIDKDDISDLGNALKESKEYVNSVFNENYGLVDFSNSHKEKSVQNQERKTLFNIYALDFNNKDVFVGSAFDGTQVVINMPHIDRDQECRKYYFRIRVKGDCLKAFIKRFKPESWYLQGDFTATDTVDFRINEKRNLNDSLVEEIANKKNFMIKKIHFLLMRDAPDEIIADHLNITCRELEPKLWQTYVGEKYNVNDVIAYHWSEKEQEEGKSIESFNTLVKIKYNKTTVWIILKYVCILILIAVISNVIYDTFVKWLVYKIFHVQ